MSSAVFGGGVASSSREIADERAQSPAPSQAEETKEEDKVFVALDVKDETKNLIWVLGNTSWKTKIVIVHVHCPALKIPLTMGGWFPASQATEEQVAAYRKLEREEIEQRLDEYINMCAQVKVKRAEKLVIDSDDVGKGLVELIDQHEITQLVMGAAAGSKFHWRIKGPVSKAALTVQEQADPTCNVRFLYKGKLICTRPSSEGAFTNPPEGFSVFSYSMLKKATRDFSESLKIGEGGYGSVYKGTLRQTTAAIKLLKPEGMQGKQEFHREVNALSKVRHPNLVTLIGACPEKYALVYEFLPGGSLEDRLARKNNTPALTWQVRTRIATEICSALVFLHSNKPLAIVHGDLKPENILLDANLVSKLGDFGLCRLLIQSSSTTTVCHLTDHPGGTLFYMDPEVLCSGEVTARSDVYSFGVILLRLLTGKSPMGIRKQVQEALDQGFLDEIIDPSAGEWPYLQAKQLVALGVQCCETDRRNRPHSKDVVEVLEQLMNAASSSFRLSSLEGRRHYVRNSSGHT